MTKLQKLLILVLTCPGLGLAQTSSDLGTAQALADEGRRQAAVAKITASGSPNIPLLLSWSRNPPHEVDRLQFFIGLADVFGQLRTKEAIPFLVQNISLTRSLESSMWMKTPGVIEDRLPAAAALIRIGPESTKVLINAYWERMGALDRRAAIFAVSRIGGEEARSFLNQVLTETDFEHTLAQRGLKDLGRQP